jgi:hypothetical protein
MYDLLFVFRDLLNNWVDLAFLECFFVTLAAIFALCAAASTC